MLGYVLVALCLSVAIISALAMREAVAAPVVRKATVELPDFDPDRAPLRIALLSDIHIGNRTMQPARLGRIVDAVNAEQPDLVVIVGDFVNGAKGELESGPAALTEPLSRLRAPLGVVATLGNHDHWTKPAKVRKALVRAGVTVLSNQASLRGPITLIGIDDAYSGHADLSATLASAEPFRNAPMVAISHSPDLSPQLPPTIKLLLAGHTHCGQMVLPVIGALAPVFGRIVGDRHYYDERFECGLVEDSARTTIVTAGLGSGSIPMRLGAAPDWWLVTVVGESD